MKTNLFINFYIDNTKARHRENEICILSNIYNKEIDRITILCSKEDVKILKELINKVKDTNHDKKVIIVKFNGRPTYNDYFKLTEKYTNDINIIANTDMIMEVNSLASLKNWHWGNYCLALSRWDFSTEELKQSEAVHFNRSDSQDTWITKGSFPQIPGINFGLGIAGCDNRIADLLSNFYQVINPSLNIKTYHYHLSAVRHYIDKQGIVQYRVDPPYKLITPTSLQF